MAKEKSSIRIIKKYPNRRVYDTHDSKYIKVSDIRDMVVTGIKFKVIDSQSKEDVTRSVLLQIIIEQESETNPLFTSDNLENFIRYYSKNQGQVFSEFMDQSLAFFNYQQEQFNTGVQEMLKQNPVSMFAEFHQKNTEMWQSMQDSFMGQFQDKKDEK
ncbi:MAG: polyhydroxyalkanoate synthesis repressor PhaR [Arenicella sp.]